MVYLRVDPIKTAQPPAAREGAEARDGSCHLRMLRMQKKGKWEEDLLEWHEEDEMWEVREEGGEEDYDSDDEPLQTSRQRFAAGAAAASAGQ